ncbi:MAG: hypothetical protein FWD71_08480 [Oscillospiraceae bacterium]|nr:hypothetical protein [Oscillospiraceae bacterium]
MGRPLSAEEQETFRRQFDSFCKKVLRHAAFDYDRAVGRLAAREISLSDYENTYPLSTTDTYFSQDRFFNVLDKSFLVKGYAAELIAVLPEIQRGIIILTYFTKTTDEKIGEILNISCKKVRYQRKNALEKLRKIKKEN